MKKTTTQVDERGLDLATLVQPRPMVMKDGQSFMISRYIDFKSVLKGSGHYLANTRVKMLL